VYGHRSIVQPQWVGCHVRHAAIIHRDPHKNLDASAPIRLPDDQPYNTAAGRLYGRAAWLRLSSETRRYSTASTWSAFWAFFGCSYACCVDVTAFHRQFIVSCSSCILIACALVYSPDAWCFLFNNYLKSNKAWVRNGCTAGLSWSGVSALFLFSSSFLLFFPFHSFPISWSSLFSFPLAFSFFLPFSCPLLTIAAFAPFPPS